MAEAASGDWLSYLKDFVGVLGGLAGICGAVVSVSVWKQRKNRDQLIRHSALEKANRHRNQIIELADQLSVRDPDDLSRSNSETERGILTKLSEHQTDLITEIGDVWPSAIGRLNDMEIAAGRLLRLIHSGSNAPRRIEILHEYAETYRQMFYFLVASELESEKNLDPDTRKSARFARLSSKFSEAALAEFDRENPE